MNARLIHHIATKKPQEKKKQKKREKSELNHPFPQGGFYLLLYIALSLSLAFIAFTYLSH